VAQGVQAAKPCWQQLLLLCRDDVEILLFITAACFQPSDPASVHSKLTGRLYIACVCLMQVQVCKLTVPQGLLHSALAATAALSASNSNTCSPI
jgi:hypothetical protein